MKSYTGPVSIVSAVLLIYLISISFNFPFPLLFTLFILLHVLLIWMVIRILKDDSSSSTKTFDDYFYEDESYHRNNAN